MIQPLTIPTFESDAMNAPMIRGLINHYAGKGKVYLEVGSYQGASLTAAAHGNDHVLCIGIDNFSNFDRKGENEIRLRKEISPYPNIAFMRSDYRHALLLLAASGIKVDTYFFDGPHTYKDQLLGLECGMQLFHEDTVIIVDDTNWEVVRRANEDFRQRYGYELIFSKRTSHRNDPDWWNGVEVMKKK